MPVAPKPPLRQAARRNVQDPLPRSIRIQEIVVGIFVGKNGRSVHIILIYIKNISYSGGEGGIRTLGPPQRGQRFSRPPRSTAPAPLRAAENKALALHQLGEQITNWLRSHLTGRSRRPDLATGARALIAASIASLAAIS